MKATACRPRREVAPASGLTVERRRRQAPRRRDPEYAHLIRLHAAVAQEVSCLASSTLGTVVDLGCGSRPYDDVLRMYAHRVIGVDLPGNPLADVTHFPGESVPLPDGMADAVVSFQVLEHVPDPSLFLGEVARLIRPGGALILSAPGVWPHHPHPEDYRRWEVDGLVWDLGKVGLTVTRVVPILRGWAAAAQLLLSLLRYTAFGRRATRWPAQAVSWLSSYLIDLLERWPGSSAPLISSTYVVVARKG